MPSPVRSATATEIGSLARSEGLLGLERAVAVAQQHADAVVGSVGGDDVGDAVAVQVGHDDLKRAQGGGGGGLLGARGECAVAVAHEHAGRVVALIGGDDVDLAVAAQVGRRDAARGAAGREGLLRAGTCRRRCPAARSPCCRPGWR